jgi:hypothetical protein
MMEGEEERRLQEENARGEQGKGIKWLIVDAFKYLETVNVPNNCTPLQNPQYSRFLCDNMETAMEEQDTNSCQQLVQISSFDMISFPVSTGTNWEIYMCFTWTHITSVEESLNHF